MRANIDQRVLVDKEKVTKVRFMKFLGIILDDNIYSVNHIKSIKTSKYMAIICKERQIWITTAVLFRCILLLIYWVEL